MDELEKVEETTSADVPEIEDDGLIIINYDAVEEADESETEQQVFDKISSRRSNTSRYVRPDMNIWQRISEFWYRNKGMVLMAGIALVLIVAAIIITIPGKYDATAAMYVSFSDFPSTIVYELTEDFESFAEDWDGNDEVKASITGINLTSNYGIIASSNSNRLIDELDNEPNDMLWIVDEELFRMMIEAYGEDVFESYEGAPLWIEITFNDTINACIERGEAPRLGLCLRRMTDEFAQDKDLVLSYERSLKLLAKIKAAYPEMFE